MSVDIKKFFKNYVICTTNKLGKKIKHNHKQIISYFPLERVEMNLTYLLKLYPNNKSEYNYLLSIIDHCSKFAKTYLMKTKESNEVLKHLKLFINEIGSPHIIQSEEGNLEGYASKII